MRDDDIPVEQPKPGRRRRDPADRLPVEGRRFTPPTLLQADNVRKSRRDISYSTRVLQLTNRYTRNYPTVVPTIPGLALCLGVSEAKIRKWERESPDFADALTRLRAIQHELLVHGGLKGELNASIVKTMLAARHDYKEGREISGPGGGPIPVAVGIMDEKTAERLYFESLGRRPK